MSKTGSQYAEEVKREVQEITGLPMRTVQKVVRAAGLQNAEQSIHWALGVWDAIEAAHQKELDALPNAIRGLPELESRLIVNGAKDKKHLDPEARYNMIGLGLEELIDDLSSKVEKRQLGIKKQSPLRTFNLHSVIEVKLPAGNLSTKLRIVRGASIILKGFSKRAPSLAE